VDWKLHNNVLELRSEEALAKPSVQLQQVIKQRTAAVSFASEAASIAKNIVDILSLVDDETEYDLKATYLWGRLKNLNRFIGISQSHDELIISLQQLASQAAFTPPSAEKLKALKVFFDKLGLKVRLSEKTLDNFYDELEKAGYDLSPVI
jgi:alcohol dehydrogenase YqhD (iron-dependent ADH family)